MKTLVLVHGWGFGPGVWQPLLASLAEHCQVRAVALPGYGEAPFDPAQLPDQAIVCGWSLGAQLVLQWARQWPGKVGRLVLVGATPRFLTGPDWPAAQPPALLESFATALGTDPRGALRRFAALLNQGDERARGVTRQLTALLDSALPEASALQAGLAQLRDTDLRPALGEIRQPSLVLHGEHDPLMPLAAGRWLADHLPAGQLAVVPGAAHAPFLSQPEHFVDRLLEFIDA
jgi:pimeloyl-[acyl-carrier protein] methyl ester esterase